MSFLIVTVLLAIGLSFASAEAKTTRDGGYIMRLHHAGTAPADRPLVSSIIEIIEGSTR